MNTAVGALLPLIVTLALGFLAAWHRGFSPAPVAAVICAVQYRQGAARDGLGGALQQRRLAPHPFRIHRADPI
jgi:hypothetical protein